MVSWAHRWWVDLDFLAIGRVWRWWLGGGFSWSIFVFGWVLTFGVWLVGSDKDVLVFWLRCVLVFLWLLGFGLIWRLLCVLHFWLLRKCKKTNNIYICVYIYKLIFIIFWATSYLRKNMNHYGKVRKNMNNSGEVGKNTKNITKTWSVRKNMNSYGKNTKNITNAWSSNKIIKRKNNEKW